MKRFFEIIKSRLARSFVEVFFENRKQVIESLVVVLTNIVLFRTIRYVERNVILKDYSDLEISGLPVDPQSPVEILINKTYVAYLILYISLIIICWLAVYFVGLIKRKPSLKVTSYNIGIFSFLTFWFFYNYGSILMFETKLFLLTLFIISPFFKGRFWFKTSGLMLFWLLTLLLFENIIF